MIYAASKKTAHSELRIMFIRHEICPKEPLTLKLPRGSGYNPLCFSNAIIFHANFSETLPYTSRLLTPTFFGAHISKQFCSHVNMSEKVKCLGGCYQLPRSQFPDKIGTKCPVLWGIHVLWGMESNGTIENTVRRNRKLEIQDGGLQSGNTNIDL